MPVILPENLFPWLLKHQPEAIPSDDSVSEYWNHMAMRQDIPWVREVISTGAMYVPIYIWGDDAIFNERNEKIVAVVCGSWLDERKNSKDTVYPLFTYRVESRLHQVLLEELFGTCLDQPSMTLQICSAFAQLRSYRWASKHFKLSWLQFLGGLGIAGLCCLSDYVCIPSRGCGITQPSCWWSCGGKTDPSMLNYGLLGGLEVAQRNFDWKRACG